MHAYARGSRLGEFQETVATHLRCRDLERQELRQYTMSGFGLRWSRAPIGPMSLLGLTLLGVLVGDVESILQVKAARIAEAS